jgi:AbiU2
MDQIISNLIYSVVVGQAHLVIAVGLADSDPVVLAAAAVFFAMSIDSHLYSAQMHAARLHDRTRGALTINTLLKRAEKEAGSAKHGTAEEVREAITSSKAQLSELAVTLDALNTRRNTWLAHTDPEAIINPVEVAQEAKLSFPDLQKVFTETGSIVNEFSRLFRDITGILEIMGQTDYQTVIEFVSDVKCRHFRQYEAEFGPAPFPRPKGCK